MSLFGKILKAGFHAASAPVDVVKDAITLGGLATDRDESYTAAKLRKLKRDAEEIEEELDDL